MSAFDLQIEKNHCKENHCKENHLKLVIDYREKALISELTQNHISFENSNLTVGDIQILKAGQTCLIIERKTVNDYIASIKDHRLKNQIARIHKYQEQCSASFIILIEGSFQPTFGQLVNVSDFIYNSILNRILIDQIPIIRSDNVRETVVWIKKLLHHYQQDPAKQIKQHSTHYLETVSVKKSENLTPYNCYLLQLTQIPGVSLNMAQQIGQLYCSWAHLIESYHGLTRLKDKQLLLAKIKIGQRTLGKILSARIYHFLFPKPKLILRWKQVLKEVEQTK